MFMMTSSFDELHSSCLGLSSSHAKHYEKLTFTNSLLLSYTHLDLNTTIIIQYKFQYSLYQITNAKHLTDLVKCSLVFLSGLP